MMKIPKVKIREVRECSVCYHCRNSYCEVFFSDIAKCRAGNEPCIMNFTKEEMMNMICNHLAEEMISRLHFEHNEPPTDYEMKT